METVKVIFNHGEDYLITKINGSRESIAAYYMFNYFNVGSGAEDNMMQCTAVEFLEE